MTDYDNTNSGALFKNEKTSENQPDYTGKMTLEGGKEMRLAAWLKTSQAGKKFMSIKMSEFQEQQNTQGQEPAPLDDDMDQVPF